MLDPVARGQVQILPSGDTPVSQAQAVIAELKRLSTLYDRWDWSSIGREWNYLDPVRSLCELEGIPVQMDNEGFSGVWHLRETRALVKWTMSRAPGVDFLSAMTVNEQATQSQLVGVDCR